MYPLTSQILNKLQLPLRVLANYNYSVTIHLKFDIVEIK